MRVDIEEFPKDNETVITITISQGVHIDNPNRIRRAIVSPHGVAGWVDEKHHEVGPHIYNIPRESVPHMLIEWAYWLAIDQQKKELERERSAS